MARVRIEDLPVVVIQQSSEYQHRGRAVSIAHVTAHAVCQLAYVRISGDLVRSSWRGERWGRSLSRPRVESVRTARWWVAAIELNQIIEQNAALMARRREAQKIKTVAWRRQAEPAAPQLG